MTAMPLSQRMAPTLNIGSWRVGQLAVPDEGEHWFLACNANRNIQILVNHDAGVGR